MKTKLLRRLRRKAKKVQVKKINVFGPTSYGIAYKGIVYIRLGSELPSWRFPTQSDIEEALKRARKQYILERIEHLESKRSYKRLKKL